MVKRWMLFSCCTTMMVVLLIGLCPGRADTAPTMSMTTLTLIPVDHSWNAGLELCTEGYGSLLNVMDQTMQNALVQMHSVLGFEQDMWIGLHDRGLDSTDDYYWSNCQPLQSHWTNWNSKPLSTDNKLCVVLSQRFLTWNTQSCWKSQHVLCAKSQGTCTYELKDERTCSSDVPRKIVIAATSMDCEQLCNTEVNGTSVCWAYIFDHLDKTCQLIFGSDPYFCENDVELNDDHTLGLRRCFNLSKVSLVNADDNEIDSPLLTCPESTSSGVATTTFSTSSDHDIIATTTSDSTIRDTPSPETSSFVSDRSTTSSSAPRKSSSSELRTTGRSFPGTSTITRSSSDTSTTGRSFPETSTTTRPSSDTSTTGPSFPQTTTIMRSSYDTTITTRSFPDTTTIIGSSSDASTIGRPSPDSPITTRLSPDTTTPFSDTSTATRSFPDTTNTTIPFSDTTNTTRPFPDATRSFPDTTTTVGSSSDASTIGRSSTDSPMTTRSSPNTTTTVWSSSETTTTVGSSSVTTTTVGSSSETTTTVGSSSETTTTVGSSSETTTTVGSSSDTNTTGRSFPDSSDTVTTASSSSSINSTPTTTVLSSKPTPGVSQGGPNETVTSRTNVICRCTCLNVNTTGSLQSLNDLIEDLLLDKRNLSAYRRKHSSAGDDRPSAQSLGVGGATLLIFSVLFVLAADLTRVLSSRGRDQKI